MLSEIGGPPKSFASEVWLKPDPDPFSSDLGSAGEAVQLLKTQCFMGSSDTNTAPTELHTVSTSAGLRSDNVGN